MINLVKKIVVSGLVLLTVGLVGCSNGSSTSSGGGSEGNEDTSISPDQLAGTYEGVLELSISSSGLSESRRSPVTVVVEESGEVNIRFINELVSSQLSGNRFVVRHGIIENTGGLNCRGNVEINSLINDNRINGPVSGEGTCQQGGTSLSVDLGGTLTATRQ